MNLQYIKKALLFTLVMVFCAALTNEVQAQSKKKFKKRTAVTSAKAGKVLICASKGAKTYHKKKCTGLKRCKTKTSMVALAAVRKTRKPCRICYPKGKK